ncbi:MAG: cytochrome c [Kiloniellales bacterium]|nr:cytochrome c [Kiloniellales bacterium]
MAKSLAWLPALSAVALAAWGVAAGTAGKPTPERQAALSYLVRQDCGSCHGMTLKGGLGRPLLPEALAGAEAEALAEVILDGIPGTPMPPWRGQLSEAEALWIARALKRGTIE